MTKRKTAKPKATRKLGGKSFRLYRTHRLKTAAKKQAARLRKEGYPVRVTGKTGKWSVYKRGR